jgi:hypothetical protein
MLFLRYKFFIMKKILGLLFVMMAFSGCDDGDVVQESISLDGIVPVKCNLNNILYKIKDNQSLALEIVDVANAFKNKKETKAIINIDNTTNKLIFRTYNGEVKATNICATTFDAFPSVKEEWIATAGKIVITTIAIVSQPNATTNATKISNYNHSILLRDIIWQKPDGSTQVDNFDRPYGVYQTAPTYNLPFGFQDSPLVFKSTCPDDITIVAKSGSESMRLKLDDTTYNFLFTTATTLPNAPKTKPLTANSTLVYNLFNGIISVADFCTPLPATRPATLEEWTANISSGTSNGIIEVETTSETSASVRHTIFLRGVIFGNGNVDFYYGDRIKFGYFIANN